MARTVAEINDELKAEIISALQSVGVEIDPAVWSDVSRLRHLIHSYAVAANKLEVLFDNYSDDVDERLRSLKPPSKRWYNKLIKDFQYGFPLIAETDDFDNTGYTQQQIDESKVIKHVAVIKQLNAYGRIKLRLKIAGSNETDLIQLDADVVNALSAYLEDAAPAGDNWVVEAAPNDNIKQRWVIFYNPLILDGNGRRKDGTAEEPVRDAIKSFLKSGMPFSGTYVINYHENWVEKVKGVVIPELRECSANYGALAYESIETEYEPDGGWIRFASEADLIIEYVAHNAF